MAVLVLDACHVQLFIFIVLYALFVITVAATQAKPQTLESKAEPEPSSQKPLPLSCFVPVSLSRAS